MECDKEKLNTGYMKWPANNIAPEKWWLEDDPFLLGLGNFSQALAVKLQGGTVWWKSSNFCHIKRSPVFENKDVFENKEAELIFFWQTFGRVDIKLFIPCPFPKPCNSG